MSTAEQQAATDARKARAIRLIQMAQARTVENGCTEAEAVEASEKISALMAQFELELTDITARDTTDIVQREVYAADRCAQALVTGIGRLCSLTTYHKSGAQVCTYVIFGHTADVELGMYLYEMCVEALDHDYGKDVERNGYTKKGRDSFRLGFATRLYARMNQLREQRDAERRARMPVSGCTDLVILKDQIVQAEFEKTGVKLTTKPGQKVHDTAAYYRGREQANKVNLNNPLQDGRDIGGQLQ